MPVALADLIANAHVVSLPLRTRFRGIDQREILVFEGPQGWAEWSPFVEYGTDEAAVWLQSAIEWAYDPSFSSDQLAQFRPSVSVNATLPAVLPQQIEQTLKPFGDFATLKIKVAGLGADASAAALSADLARVNRAHELYPQARLRLDANGLWSITEAQQAIEQLEQAGLTPAIEYLEQPVATIGELAELRVWLKRSGLNLKIAADESVRKVSDPLAVAHAGAADILVLKVAPLGGIHSALRIASEANLPVVVSSALESSVGIATGLALAAALPDIGLDAGLGTAALLAADIVAEPLIAKNGRIALRRVTPDAKLLAQFAASQDRREWWFSRLTASYRALNY